MISGLFKDSSPFVKLLFTTFIILVCFTLFLGIGLFMAYLFFDVGVEGLAGNIDPKNPENIPVLKFLQACYSIGLFVFPPFIIGLFFHGKIFEYLNINILPSIHLLLLSGLLVFFALPMINFLVSWNESITFPQWLSGLESYFKEMENNAKEISTLFLTTSSTGAFIANLVVMALIPAIGEELLFRGVIQRIFHEWLRNIHLAIFLSAFIFSALHLQFYGLVPRLLLGAMFGYLFYWSKNLWIPVFAHFLNNTLAISFYFFKGNLSNKAEHIGTGTGSVLTVCFSAFAIALVLYMFYRYKKEETTEIETN